MTDFDQEIETLLERCSLDRKLASPEHRQELSNQRQKLWRWKGPRSNDRAKWFLPPRTDRGIHPKDM